MSVPPTLPGVLLPASLLLPLPPAPGGGAAHAPRPANHAALSPASALQQLETLLPVLQDALRSAPANMAAASLGHVTRAIGEAARQLPAVTLAASPAFETAVLALRNAAELLGRAEQRLHETAASVEAPPGPAGMALDRAWSPDAAWALAQTVAAGRLVGIALEQFPPLPRSRGRVARSTAAIKAAPALAAAVSAFGALLACLALLLLVGAWSAAAALGGVVTLVWIWRSLRIEIDR